MNEIDWAAAAAEDEAKVPTVDLARVGELAELQRDLERRVSEAKAETARLEEELRKVSEDLLPDLLRAAGLSEVKLADGSKLVMKTKLHASTTGKWADVINSWLEARGLDDLIKDEFKIPFGKGEGDEAAALEAFAAEHGYSFSRKRAVHPATFTALLREMIERGEDVDLAEIGVHERTMCSVKAPKK